MKMLERRMIKTGVIAWIRLEIGEVVEEQGLFNLEVVSNYTILTSYKEVKGYYTEGFSSRKQMPLTPSRTDLRTSRKPLDLMSMW